LNLDNRQATIESVSISQDQSVLRALKQMDTIRRKLLLVTNGEARYIGLVSIGDLQRHLIETQDFETPIQRILRSNPTVCHATDSPEEIKRKMIALRTEFMPILDESGELVNVIFWDELLDDKAFLYQEELDLPVVIMAGGMGTRLRPLTYVLPKALVPIGEKPMLTNIIENFRQAGCHRFWVSVNYKANSIRSYYLDHPIPDCDLHFVQEREPRGTAGSLVMMKDDLRDTFFVSNCDILVDQNLNDLYHFHMRHHNQLTITATIKHFGVPYGVLQVQEDGRVTGVREKPEYNFWVNTGLYVLEPELLDLIPETGEYNMTDLIAMMLDNNMRVGAFPISEKSWMDVGVWSEYLDTQVQWSGKM
jgi:dTDP-glucose pyrophosphorylase